MTQCGVDPPRLRDVWSLELLAHLVLRRVQSWQRRLESLRDELILLRRLRALRAHLRLHAARAYPAVVPLPSLTRRPRGTEAPRVCVSIVGAARTSGSSARGSATQEPAQLRRATARAGKGRTKEVPGSGVALDELPQRKVSKTGVPDGDVALRGSSDETPKTFLQRDHVLSINVNSYGSDKERRVLLQAKVERLAEQQSSVLEELHTATRQRCSAVLAFSAAVADRTALVTACQCALSSLASGTFDSFRTHQHASVLEAFLQNEALVLGPGDEQTRASAPAELAVTLCITRARPRRRCVFDETADSLLSLLHGHAESNCYDRRARLQDIIERTFL